MHKRQNFNSLERIDKLFSVLDDEDFVVSGVYLSKLAEDNVVNKKMLSKYFLDSTSIKEVKFSELEKILY